MTAQREWFEKDYYATLGVQKGASAKDVTKAYRKLARKLHPDANPGDEAAESRFKEVSAAYDVLGDEARRAEYDQVRAMGPMAGGMPGGGFPGGGFPGGGGFDLGDLFGGLFGGGGHGAPRGRRGADLETRLTSVSEARDVLKDKLRQRYAPRVATLAEKIRRQRQAVDREAQQASDSKLQTGISVLGTVMGALFGRKRLSTGTIGKATTAARGMGRTMREAGDVERAQQTLAAYEQQLAALEGELEAELAGLEAAAPPADRAFSTIEIRPKRTHVTAQRIVLVWRPA